MGLIFITLVGGLGLFVYGMNLMSRGIEKVAGNRLRGILEAFTKNKFLGLVVGLFFTAVIQSSSAATVMVVSFVNSGLMNLAQASGIILGANIGTTVTALLVAFRLSTVAPIIVFIGSFMVNFIKKPQIRKIGEIVLGFGILFVGISTMSGAMGELRDMPEVIDFLAGFTNPFLAVLLGLVITSVVQSSSVTVSILVVMGSQGLVDLHTCMFVILGCNIGACTSAVLASLGGSKNAKRASLIHLLFNIFGTILMFVLLLIVPDPIEGVIHFVSGNGTDAATLGRNIAVTHFLFKVFQVIVFYPFMNFIIKCTYLLVPGEDVTDDEGYYTQYIDNLHLPNPTVAITSAVKEMERMAYMAFENLNDAVECICDLDEEKSEKVFAKEKYIDYLDEEISNYLVKINQNALPYADASLIAAYFHIVNDIERIGDHANAICKMIPQFGEDIRFSENSCTELRDMMRTINKMMIMSLDMFLTGNQEHMQEIRDMENDIDIRERELQAKHISRLSQGKCSAQAGVFFSDIVSSLERVSDHAINIAFTLKEAKEALG